MSSRKTTPGKSVPSLATTTTSDNQENSSVFQQHTPPPDNFGHIKPCSHIKSVIGTKAKDTILITYKQAVSIVTAANENFNNKVFTQKKNGLPIPKNKLADFKLKSLKCTDCSLNNFYHNFICLQCPHVGCFNDENHAYSHYKLNQHLFGIDSHNGLLYCFLCGDYVNTPSLEKIRVEVTTVKDEPQEEENEEVPTIQDNVSDHYTNPTKIATLGLKGFVNLGSTCFMSCILQSFVHNPIIKYHFFNNDYHYFNCNSNMDYLMDGENIDESNACITCSIDKIFKEFFTSDKHEGFGMTNLLMTAWYKKKSLAGFQEQDAHEFWQFLLNEFHLDHERITKKLQGENPNKYSGNDQQQEIKNVEECKCITHTTFAGELQSSIKCLNCKSITSTIDPLMDLSLEINHLKSKSNNQPISLYDCLDLFTKDEKLDVMYTCQSCHTKSKAIKSLKIKKLPPVLSIQLKRFEHNLLNDTSAKIQTPVTTPLFLDITRYTADYDLAKYQEENPQMGKNDTYTDTNKIYELFTVVSHIGSVNTGHYIVMVKTGDGQWFKFDDSVVSLISQEEVMRTNAYLLFYITHRI